MKKFLPLLLALMMVICLAACGGGNTTNTNNENLYTLGDYQIEYKGAKIAPDDDGATSVILTLGFTNNSKSSACYGFNISEKAEQGGEFMYIAALNSISDEYYYREAEPGETVDVIIGFNLNAVDYQGNLNYSDEVKVTLGDIYSDKSITLTIDPADTPFADSATGPVGGGSVESGDNTIDSVNSGSDSTETGEAQGHGDFAALLIPDEFELVLDSWNEENPHFVSVKRSDFSYFDFHNFTDESEMTKDYEYVKKTYTHEQSDVSATYNGIEWNGFQYGDGFGGYAFEVYTIIGSNYLRVSSAGFAFDNDIAAAVLGSVTMADGSSASVSGVDSVNSEINPGDDWLDYWSGDWYGWWIMTDGTGEYAKFGDCIWDACARIEVDKTVMTGYMTLWDDEGSTENLIAGIELGFANPDDSEFGVMFCNGGQFLSDTLEPDAWYVNPDQINYENIFDFRGEYEDEYGTFSYRVLLRPWGTVWDDLGEEYYPFYYEDWYLPLIEAGEDMPDSFN